MRCAGDGGQRYSSKDLYELDVEQSIEQSVERLRLKSVIFM